MPESYNQSLSDVSLSHAVTVRNCTEHLHSPVAGIVSWLLELADIGGGSGPWLVDGRHTDPLSVTSRSAADEMLSTLSLGMLNKYRTQITHLLIVK